MIDVSYVFKKSYFQVKTFLYLCNNMINAMLSSEVSSNPKLMFCELSISNGNSSSSNNNNNRNNNNNNCSRIKRKKSSSIHKEKNTAE